MAFYLMNTDREARNDVETCDLWFQHEMAFAGNREGHELENAGIFRVLQPQDTVFMWHSGRGCVGVGQVLEEWDQHVYRGAERLLYVEEPFEYRIGVNLDGPDERARRLAAADPIPRRTLVVSHVFDRNPDVVVEVLRRAEGTCERCRTPAPFNRRTDGSPYLEVHHITTLADGGEDTVQNALALCPNCHRRAHYGE
jgi:hypothetical protein